MNEKPHLQPLILPIRGTIGELGIVLWPEVFSLIAKCLAVAVLPEPEFSHDGKKLLLFSWPV